MQRTSALSFCTLFIALLTACGSAQSPPSQTTPSEAGPASSSPSGSSVMSAAYKALIAGESDKAPALIQAVDGVVLRDPNDGRATLYSGFMRLWDMDQGHLDPLQLLDTATTAINRFSLVRQLLPDDDRGPGILGLTRVKVGRATGNSAMVSQGLSDLDAGIAIFPAYAHFLRAQATDTAPGNSADFAAVVSHMFAVLDACQQLPDASGVYMYPAGPLDTKRRPCNDEGIVFHVFEGFFLHFGDYLLKAGWTADKVRPIYRSAMNSPTFGHWPFAPQLQQRIEQADQRAALYADSDPTNDPILFSASGQQCLGCHQNTP
ncbi:MAG: hypothetical protein M3O46_05865 [Myxococcota bacterium]|nr:hypothetical protein [Myxococcota bacterium]